ncbi:DNA polymerase III subunit beta [Candidatus Omnitrophus magneticus]|uniref:Beta sliding clamp n=1 Tax=Candidatus Omnitrophus magneticus TaxID=1609969 RepID=A0A0F0CME9_9BACT|nr:DNA polymerase III subunit beta [Candidatus Omnitrophus magneticus]
MDLTIQKELLLNGIQIIQNAISQKSNMPILSNVLFESTGTELKLTATDLELGICTKIPVLVGQEGAITIPAKKFFDIIKALPDNIEVEISLKKNNSITIKGGNAVFKIIGLPKEEFPTLPLFEDKDAITISKSIFKEMINLTDFSVSKEDSRHVLTGVLLSVKQDVIKMVSTDGRRMAAATKKIPLKTLIERNAIIPLKAVLEIKRLLNDDGDLKILFSNNQILFSFSSTYIISRIIEGEFPDFEKVIPEKTKKIVSIQKEDFLNAVKRVSIFTDQDSQAVKIEIQKNKMTISKNTPYLGEAREEIAVDFSGDKEIQIGFNPRYLIDVLKVLGEEFVEMEISDPTKPGVIRKQEEYVYVVLPMQVVG